MLHLFAFLVLGAVCLFLFDRMFTEREHVRMRGHQTGRTFYVRPDRPQEAIGALEEVYAKLERLVNEVADDPQLRDHAMAPHVRRIRERLPKVIIHETARDSPFTSYSVNKGEELFFCLRDKETQRFHDMNDVMYVAIHEIAHIGTPEVGHTDMFAKINKFLLDQAVKRGIYSYVDYSVAPKPYCGIQLTTNILNRT